MGYWKTTTEILYVEDFADAIDFLIKSDWSEDLINIGSGQEISIKELSETIKDIVGFDGILEFDDSNQMEIPKLLDSSLIFEKDGNQELLLRMV